MTSQLKAPAATTAQEAINRISQGFIASSAMGAIARLNVADALVAGPLHVDALAAKLKVNADALCRALRLLACGGVFEETAEKIFANNDGSDLLRSDAPNTMRDLVTFLTDPFHFRAYADMIPSIKDGRTAAEHLYGKNIFEVFAEDADEQRLFDNAMTSISKQAVPSVLEAYDFSGIETLVDVAGGHGMLLTSILEKYPTLKGVVFDLPHVVTGANWRIEKLGLTGRCTTAPGDFFKAVPAADAIIMKHIIHDWDDVRALTILKNCKAALKDQKKGKVILVELLLSGRNQADASKFMDIEMLMLPGGRERTQAEFSQLFEKAGLKLNKVVQTKSPFFVIEAVCT